MRRRRRRRMRRREDQSNFFNKTEFFQRTLVSPTF